MKVIEADDGLFISRRRLVVRKCEPNIPEEGRITIVHGGSVNNSYDYPAETEAALAYCKGGIVVVWRARLPANKVTLSGAAGACLPGAWPLFDDRCKKSTKDQAREVIKEAFYDCLGYDAGEEEGGEY